MIEFHVQTGLKGWRIGPAAFRRAARLLASKCLSGITAGEISVSFLSAARMARINEEYLGHSGPTDVITFDYSSPRKEPRGSISSRENAPASVNHVVSGEILICPEVASAQGCVYGTGWKLEVLRYLAHGLLHLAGHDDQDAPARKAMKLAEDEAMEFLTAELGSRWAAPPRSRGLGKASDSPSTRGACMQV